MACVLVLSVAAFDVGADEPPPAATTDIRQIASAHLTLHTDLAPSPEVDALPGVFDVAFEQWCAYFGLDATRHADWHMRGCLMKTPERFRAAGLLPADVPEFKNGFTRGEWLWLHDQTSPYYRRHLLLHEGTHAFMFSLIGGAGPPWLSEGLAELMATHRLVDGTLTLNCFPRARDEVPKWGRIEIVQTGFAARRAMSLAKIFTYGPRAHLENEPYGWCWAAAAFLDGQPRYQSRFRQLHHLAARPDFNEQVAQIFAPDAARLNEDWQLFVANLDYGYDFSRMEVDYDAPAAPLPAEGARVTIAADRGWQASGVRLEAGKTYRLRASGRYQVSAGDSTEPRPWQCEPGGVTIRYYHGQPLGILLAAVRADEPEAKGPSGLVKPIVVGLGTALKPDRSGTLYFRINHSAGSLADNAGALDVEVSKP